MKIWRYMDLAKFISLLSEKAIFFAAQNQFPDPLEGHLPVSYEEAEYNKIIFPLFQQIELAKKILKSDPNFIDSEKNKDIEELLASVVNGKNLGEEVKKMFAFSCWHINNYENEALWKIYTNQGQGIAIETTTDKLERSLTYHQKIVFNKVRYEDFHTASIEKGHQYYRGFLKRKAFEYEKEFRAGIKLDEVDFGKGCFIPVDLDMLIEKIHVSPLVPKYFLESVRFLCNNDLSFLQDRIIQSSLYDKPLFH
ncbi:MAG: DUF2971 domain-containing protein [Sulfuricurvum sp.]|nr:DUF2971 domain-containing protein [Sulfuricurvum sp.]